MNTPIYKMEIIKHFQNDKNSYLIVEFSLISNDITHNFIGYVFYNNLFYDFLLDTSEPIDQKAYIPEDYSTNEAITKPFRREFDFYERII